MCEKYGRNKKLFHNLTATGTAQHVRHENWIIRWNRLTIRSTQFIWFLSINKLCIHNAIFSSRNSIASRDTRKERRKKNNSNWSHKSVERKLSKQTKKKTFEIYIKKHIEMQITPPWWMWNWFQLHVQSSVGLLIVSTQCYVAMVPSHCSLEMFYWIEIENICSVLVNATTTPNACDC